MKAKWIMVLCLIISSPLLMAKDLTAYSVKTVIQAQELADKQQLNQAITLLRKSDSNHPYDRAYISRILGIFLWQSGDTEGAIKALLASLTSQQLEPRMNWTSQRMLADLYLSQENYRKALNHYRKMVDEPLAGEEIFAIWLRIAQASYQLEEWSNSLSASQQYESSGGKASINTLSVKLGAQLQLKQLKAALTTVDSLLALAPAQRNFWLQKVSLQLQLQQQNQALATLQLAELQQVKFERSDWLMLAQLYAQNSIPERAARILAQLDLQADASLQQQLAVYWQQARQWKKALDAWQVLATTNPQFYWQIAGLQMQLGQYQAALHSLNQLPADYEPSKVALTQANALYQLGDYAQALQQAQLAHRLKPGHESARWIDYLSQLEKHQMGTSS